MFKDTKYTKGSMAKNLCLLAMLTLLTGCFGSVAFLGPASTTAASGASGNIARGAFTSSVSYGVKKTTGKLPLEHAVAYAEEKNPRKKKEPCLSFAEITNSIQGDPKTPLSKKPKLSKDEWKLLIARINEISKICNFSIRFSFT